MADRKISDLTALTAPAAGDYLPIVDISEAAAANKNKRITIEELFRGAPDGTAAAPSIGFESDPNTGIYSPGADQVAISTNGQPRLFVDASGLVGIGTTSPYASTILHVENANATGDDNVGNVFIGTTDTVAANIGGKLTLGGMYNTTGSLKYAFAGMAGRRENATNNNLAGYLQLLTCTSGGTLTERARLDSSGRLLVGTSGTRDITGGNFTLQIEGNGTSPYSGISILNKANSAVPAYLILAKSRGGTNGVDAVSNASGGDAIGDIWFGAADGTDLASASARITCFVDGAVSGDDVPGRLVLSTTADGASSPTERMRITNGGATGFYCDSTVDTLYSSSAAAAGTSRYLFIGTHSATAPLTGTNAILIFTNGNVQNTNNSYGAISDIKLKENIVDANSQWDDLKALQVRNYNFKEGQTHTQIGLIAQEVELVSPGLVSESPDRDEDGNDLGTVTKSVNYSVLYMKAVKALQEAMERIETLEAEVAALKAQ